MERNTQALGTESVGKLLFRLSLPSIAAQIINLLYNLVDRMYLGHIEGIGKSALTGVGVCLPLIMMITAFSSLIGMGGAPRASIALGKGDRDGAEKILGSCAAALLCVSALLTAVFAVFSRPMLLAFGASGETIAYAQGYMGIYSLGTVFVQLTLGLNPFISAQGFAKISMMTVLIGAVCNIILDPIFIFAFGMGTGGAALATIISQAVSAGWILMFLSGKKTFVRLSRRRFRISFGILLPCLALGLSPFIMQATESLISVCFNASLYRFGGDLAVGAMTIFSSVMQFSMLPLLGLTQGAGPIMSYNYGAGKPDRVVGTFKRLAVCTMSYAFLLWALVMLFPSLFIRIFNGDADLVAFATPAMRVYMAGSFMFGAQITCQQTFIALGNAPCSIFLALLRKIVLLIPLIYVLPAFIADHTTAVFLAEPIADITAAITTCILFAFQFKKSVTRLSQSAAVQK